MEWLSSASTQNLIAILLALITGVYALLTWRILVANRRMIDTMTSQFQETVRPYIIARLSVRDGIHFTLTIENTGRSSAQELSLSMDRDYYLHDGAENVRQFPAFNREIPMFAPGEQLNFSLGLLHQINKERDGKILCPNSFLVGAKYRFGKVTYEDEFVISTDGYMSTLVTKSTNDHLSDISNQLKQILQTLHRG